MMPSAVYQLPRNWQFVNEGSLTSDMNTGTPEPTAVVESKLQFTKCGVEAPTTYTGALLFFVNVQFEIVGPALVKLSTPAPLLP